MSITSFFGWGGMGAGAFIAGLLFDMNGNYVGSFAFASVMGVLNLIVLSLFYYRIKSQREPPDDTPLARAISS